MGQFGLADSERCHNICHFGQSTETSRRRPPQCHLQYIQEDKASDSLLAYAYGDCVWGNAMGNGEVRTTNMQDGGQPDSELIIRYRNEYYNSKPGRMAGMDTESVTS